LPERKTWKPQKSMIRLVQTTTYLSAAVSIICNERSLLSYVPRKEDGALVLKGQQRLVEVLHLHRGVEADVEQANACPPTQREYVSEILLSEVSRRT
jgi:hypothetical protein